MFDVKYKCSQKQENWKLKQFADWIGQAGRLAAFSRYAVELLQWELCWFFASVKKEVSYSYLWKGTKEFELMGQFM